MGRGRARSHLLASVCTEGEGGFLCPFPWLLGPISGKIRKCATHNYTSKHNIPRQIYPISKQARIEVRTGVSDIRLDYLHVCPTQRLFLNYSKGLAPAERARKLHGVLRAPYSSAELKLKQLNPVITYIFLKKSSYAQCPFFLSQHRHIYSYHRVNLHITLIFGGYRLY